MTDKFKKGYITDISYEPGCAWHTNNVYVDLKGHIRPRHNPTSGLYYFDGQIFYRKRLTEQ